MATVKKIVYLNEDGILARTQGGEIVNIGGTSNNTFTVAGKNVMLEGGLNSTIDFQYVYDQAVELDGSADIKLQSGKAFTILSEDALTTYFNVDADSGNITISGLLNGIDLNLVSDHLTPSNTVKHTADEISVDNIQNASTVQEALTNIENTLSTGITSKFITFAQTNPLSTWTIVHNQNTKRVVWSLWTENDEMILPDNVVLIDMNTIEVSFGSPQAGKIDMIFYVN